MIFNKSKSKPMSVLDIQDYDKNLPPMKDTFDYVPYDPECIDSSLYYAVMRHCQLHPARCPNLSPEDFDTELTLSGLADLSRCTIIVYAGEYTKNDTPSHDIDYNKAMKMGYYDPSFEDVNFADFTVESSDYKEGVLKGVNAVHGGVMYIHWAKSEGMYHLIYPKGNLVYEETYLPPSDDSVYRDAFGNKRFLCEKVDETGTQLVGQKDIIKCVKRRDDKNYELKTCIGKPHTVEGRAIIAQAMDDR